MCTSRGRGEHEKAGRRSGAAVEDPPNGKLVTRRETFELVVLDDEWKWVLPEADVQAFQKGTCPT